MHLCYLKTYIRKSAKYNTVRFENWSSEFEQLFVTFMMCAGA